MTKLKNTKKGMAKKALSISLVAAMLATSNVPVWAAEDLFSDGSAAVEAPVVEEPAAEVDTFSAEPVEETNTNDVATYAASSTLALQDVVWGSAVELADGSTLVDNDGNEVKEFTFEWLINGSQPVDEDGKPMTNSHTTSGGLAGIGLGEYFTPQINHVGCNLTLKITGIGNDIGFVYETAPVVVKAKNVNNILSDQQIAVADHANTTYTGKAITVTASDIWVATNNENLTSEDFIYTYEGDTVNANAEDDQKGYVIATVNKEGYTGYKKFALNIKSTTTNADSFDVSLNKKEYEYTGSAITPSETDVTVTNNYTGGKVDSSALKGGLIFTSGLSKVGDSSSITVNKIDVTKDEALNGNVNYHSSSTYTTSEKATVVARKLSNTTIKVNDGLWVPGHTYTEADVRGCITIYDSEGNELNLDNDINVTVPNITGTGDYQVTISGRNNNVVGSVNVTLPIRTNSLSSGNFDKNAATEDEYFTGEKITKSASRLGQFKVNGVVLVEGKDYEIIYDNNTNVSTEDKKATITVKGIGQWGGQKEYSFDILPAEIKENTITVPKTVLYDGAKISASDYLKKDDITVKANTKVRNASGVLVDTTIDVPADSYDVEFTIDGNTGIPKLDDIIKTTVVNKDTNFSGTTTGVKIVAEKGTTISNRSLAEDAAVVEVVGGPYTYTGKVIIPELKVTYDGTELRKDKDYKVITSTNATEAGTATVTVQGIGDFSGTKTVNFTINPANISDVSITPKKDSDTEFEYTGKQVKPGITAFDITLNGVDVSSNFTIAYPISSYDNVEVGTGKGTLTPVTGNKNFAGGTKEFTFEIQPQQKEIAGTITAWDEDGKVVTLKANESEAQNNPIFHYDGTAKEFAKVEFTPTDKNLKEGVDYEVKYYNNITGPVAAIYVNAIGNYTNPKTNKFDGSEQTYANAAFYGIEGVKVYKENVDVNDTTYGGGITLKPNVTITVGGRNLIEGIDYKFTNIIGDCVNVTATNNTLKATIEFIGGYSNSDDINISWKIVAKDLKDTDITATKADGNLNVTVMNGSVQVPTSEYDVKDNGDGTVTVTAKSTSKNYTGSQTVTLVDEDTSIGTPIITEVQVSGNKATVVLAGECDGATGYDYVISTVNDYENGRLANGINKNQLTTQTSYQYLNQGIYYAYCHAWKRVNGVKVFSEWSNIMPFSVSSITPDQPSITKIEKSSNGKHLRVTWTKSANATGYDVVMGTKLQKVNGEYRPTEYGKAVKKVTNGDTVSVIFYNIPKGTYYVGLHAYNRTSETGVKVFSPWSNSKKVTF